MLITIHTANLPEAICHYRSELPQRRYQSIDQLSEPQDEFDGRSLMPIEIDKLRPYLTVTDSAGNGHEIDMGTILQVEPLIIDHTEEDFSDYYIGDMLSAQPADIQVGIAEVMSETV